MELREKHFVLMVDIDLGWLTLDEALIAADANAVELGFQGLAPRVYHLYMDDVQITEAAGTEYVGPIAGTGEETLEDYHTAGLPRGDARVGQFVGQMKGTVAGCASVVQVECISCPVPVGR